MLGFYKELIDLRKRVPALSKLTKEGLEISANENTITMKRQWKQSEALAAMNFSKKDSAISYEDNMAKDKAWTKRIDSSDREWLGTGPVSPDELFCQKEFMIKPLSFVLYERHR